MITALLEMNFGNPEGGLEINLDKIAEKDIIKILFSENPGVLIQVKDKNSVEKILQNNGMRVFQNRTAWQRTITF